MSSTKRTDINYLKYDLNLLRNDAAGTIVQSEVDHSAAVLGDRRSSFSAVLSAWRELDSASVAISPTAFTFAMLAVDWSLILHESYGWYPHLKSKAASFGSHIASSFVSSPGPIHTTGTSNAQQDLITFNTSGAS
jgi:hypothetical protein